MSLRACLYSAFVLLQGADVVLTWLLLTTRPEVQEANPIALAVLESHGWPGAIALKLACTAIVLGCVLAIERARPPLYSQGVIAALSSLMLVVVVYSTALLVRPADPVSLEIEAGRRVTDALTRELSSLNELQARRSSLCADLLARRLDLPEAVRRMAGDLHRLSPRLRPRTRASLPSSGRPESVAQYLIGSCDPTSARSDHEAMGSLREQLARHYPSAEDETRPDAPRALLAMSK